MTLIAVLLSLMSATALYGASRHQRLLREALPARAALIGAAVLAALSWHAWATVLWATSATAATLSVIMLGAVAWPILLAIFKPAAERVR
ncbi:hypothetical protein ACDA63_06495 [Uliginosibacterium sp. sgz301328]|uniref:hypothetical protein n=1 Tax=Uliginosibacterium sp. sgz301328 TaxID=3243764 RepID=UPI00359D508F